MIYAIGDIHGNLTALDQMYDLIKADMADYDEPHKIIFLGDYIDRGPKNPEVVDAVVYKFPVITDKPLEIVRLFGNHELMARDALSGDFYSDAQLWLFNGGRETLDQYLQRDGSTKMLERFIETLEGYHRVGKFFFVHAGINPLLPLERQMGTSLSYAANDRDGMQWIRGGFGSFTEPFDRLYPDGPVIVVHGHTPVTHDAGHDHGIRPVVLDNRINLDTGAVWTGTLSAARFDNEGTEFLGTLMTTPTTDL